MKRTVPADGERSSAREVQLWLTAMIVYCLFVVLPALLAAVRGGTERGDVRKDARAFAEAYGSDVAVYFAGAPRASKLLELSAFVVLPVVLFLLALPRGKIVSLLDVGRAVCGGALLVLLGHIAVYWGMRVGGGTPGVAWSWMWRLTVITVISSAAELGLIALAFNWLGARRGLAFSLLLVCSALGAVLRLYHGCAIPLVPACIDASLLGGRPREQIVGGIVALSWLGFAVFLIARRRARKSAKEDAGSAAVA